MDNKIVNEGVEKSGESFVKDHGFAAVPIHFKPGVGAVKKIALVIPGIEPPLAFFELSGDSPEDLTFIEIDGHTDSVSQGTNDEAEHKDVQLAPEVSETDETSEDVEESTEAEDVPETEDKEDVDETIEYPHEDENGDKIAGFLIGNEEFQPLVILVRPQEGESVEEAMLRVSKENPEHIPGTLEEATKLLGHSPLTKADN